MICVPKYALTCFLVDDLGHLHSLVMKQWEMIEHNPKMIRNNQKMVKSDRGSLRSIVKQAKRYLAHGVHKLRRRQGPRIPFHKSLAKTKFSFNFISAHGARRDRTMLPIVHHCQLQSFLSESISLLSPRSQMWHLGPQVVLRYWDGIVTNRDPNDPPEMEVVDHAHVNQFKCQRTIMC